MGSKYLVKNTFGRKLLVFENYKSFLEISLGLNTIKLGQCIYSQLLFKKTCKSDYSGMFWHILFINQALLVTAEQIVCICWEGARWQWENAHGYLGTAKEKWRKKDLEEKVLNFNWNVPSNMMNTIQPPLGACQFYIEECIWKGFFVK